MSSSNASPCQRGELDAKRSSLDDRRGATSTELLISNTLICENKRNGAATQSETNSCGWYFGVSSEGQHSRLRPAVTFLMTASARRETTGECVARNGNPLSRAGN